MSPVTRDRQQRGLEHQAQGRGRFGDPSGGIAEDFRKVPMEIAMVGSVGRTGIQAQEEAGSWVGSARQELAERGVVALREPGDVPCQVPHLLLAVPRG